MKGTIDALKAQRCGIINNGNYSDMKKIMETAFYGHPFPPDMACYMYYRACDPDLGLGGWTPANKCKSRFGDNWFPASDFLKDMEQNK